MMLFVLENGTAQIPDCQERRYLYRLTAGQDGTMSRVLFPPDPDFGGNIYKLDGNMYLEAYTEFVTKQGDLVQSDRKYYFYSDEGIKSLTSEEIDGVFAG